MPPASLLRLIVLAAIWGASFVFMRIGVAALGPAWLIVGRVVSAALFLGAVGLLLRKRLGLRAHWRHYLVLGALNSAIPFLLIGYAAQTLTAALMSVLNATAPIFGALIGSIALRRMPPATTLVGLALGVGGVALLVGFDTRGMAPGALIAVCATAGAAFCYGLASVYAKAAPKVDSFANAHGTMVAAALLCTPALAFSPSPAMPSAGVVAAVLALGVVCSGVAYLLYFRLIDEVGATPALSVTFLIPVFGVLWGHLFLGEVVGWHTLAGALAVLIGTALVTGFSPRELFARKAEGSA